MTSHNKGQIVGYIRVSTIEQNTERQDLGADVDRIFEEKISAKDRNRPKLNEMLKYVRDGDTIRVHSMDRLARSLLDLSAIVKELTESGVTIEFLKEGITFEPGNENPYALLQLHLIGAFAQFERSILLERQREGIAKAKAAGKYKGRTPALNSEQVAEIRDLAERGVPKAQLARRFSVSRHTIYDALRSNYTTKRGVSA